MDGITFKGSPIQIMGEFPQVGQVAPDFCLVTNTLTELSLSDLKGKRVVFNIFPSVDTSVCLTQLKTFSQLISQIQNTVLLFASLDLPFAFARACVAEGVDNAITASDYRHHSLAKNYGVKMVGGKLDGLYARAVLVLDESHNIIYSDFMREVTHEPSYEEAMSAVLS